MDPLGGVFFIYFFYIFSSNSILDESVLKSVIKPQGQPTTVSSYMLKTLFRLSTVWAIQSTFRSLEMNSKRCYKICICSVIQQGPNLSLFEIISAPCSISFPKILDAIERFTKVRIFLILLYIAFLSPKILGFLFTTKKNLTWRVKCEKSNFGKSWRIYWKSSSKIVHEWNGHLEIFQPSSSNRKFQAIFAFKNRYFIENGRWVPLPYWHLAS